MDLDLGRLSHRTPEEQGAPLTPASGKQPWQEPKLTFIEPILIKHGTLEDVTGEPFFTTFTPQRP